MGDALVRNEQGQAYFRAININNEDHEIVVPTLTLKNFTMYENQEDSQSSVLKSRSLNVVASVKVISVTGSNHGNNRRMSQQNEINKKDRAAQVESLLRLEHLNAKEIENVLKLLQISSDCFHLPGERLGNTQILSHRIITTGEKRKTDQLDSAKYFSTFYVKSGFHQIEMHRDYSHKIAFSMLAILNSHEYHLGLKMLRSQFSALWT